MASEKKSKSKNADNVDLGFNEVVPAEEVKVEAPAVKKLVMRTNVRMDHVDYLKGSEVPAKHLEFFIKEGFTEEV